MNQKSVKAPSFDLFSLFFASNFIKNFIIKFFGNTNVPGPYGNIGRMCIQYTPTLVNQQSNFKTGPVSMVQTSKTDHFLKLAPFWSPLTDLIDFGMDGKLLTSAIRRCSPFVDSVSRIWIKPKISLIGCWAPTATTFGQSAPRRVQLTAGRNGHNRHFERCPWSV